MKRAAIYFRLTPMNVQQESQINQLRKAAKERGLEVVAQYSDRVWRPADRRPGLNDLLFDAKKGKFDHLIVYSLADVARSLRHCLETIRSLNKLGVGIVSHQDGIDISGEPDGSGARIVSALYEVHRSLFSEAVRAGMRRSRLDGIPLGRRPVEVNRSAMLQDRAAGLSFSSIGKKNGVSKALAYKIIAETRNQPEYTMAVSVPSSHEPHANLTVAPIPYEAFR